jgi:predicted RNA-binding protein YlxR (DUF448 family)
MRSAYKPQRMCHCCRERFDKQDLTRFVVREGRIEIDPTGRANGRGAYLCADAACRAKAKKTRALERALQAPTDELLWQKLEVDN